MEKNNKIIENNRNYAILIDDLRREYKFSQEEFCFDICSVRNYRRMINGIIVMKHDNIYQFCEKLQISLSDFYYLASKRDRSELQKIFSIYQMIYSHDYSLFVKTISGINRKRLISKQNERFLDFCILKAKLVHKVENDQTVINKLMKLIDYPNCLSKETFDFVDINILMLIAEIQVKFDKEECLVKLENILNSDNQIIARSDTSQLLPTIYSNCSLLLLRLKKYEEAYKLASSGIDYSLKYNNMSSLGHLHYCKSHSLLNLGKRKEAEIEAAYCISSAISKNNKEEIKVFFKELEYDHKINPIELLKRHQNTINTKKQD